jgi:16S rRNA (guanine527-N7)-methyltransferase
VTGEPGYRWSQAVFGDQFPTVERYVDILTSTGIDYGLLGPREVGRIWERHILNSVAAAHLIPPGASLADVGSGAGLPGLPLAILRPDATVTLLEPMLRRSSFLDAVVAELGLSDHVSVARVRAADHAGAYDVVTARAVAPLERLIGWCNPLRAPAGVVLALKGRTAAAEVQASSRALRRLRLAAQILHVQAHAEAEPTTVVRVAAAGPVR